MKIILEIMPPNINHYIGRTNWYEYQEKKKEYHRYVKLKTLNINPKPNYKKCEMIVTYHFKDRRKRDTHNLTKCLLDALVEAKIIEDDNYEVLKLYTEKGVYDRKNEFIEIEINPCN
jgi:Holliday junction resolvase RusA-like endonuclease